MPFIPVPNVASFELIFEVWGQKCENVMYCEGLGSWDQAELTAVCEAIVDWAETYWAPQAHEDVVLSKIVAKDLTSSTGPAIEYSVGMPIPGEYTQTGLLPLNVTCAVSFGTALRGRSYRGRIFVVGLAQADVTANQLTSGARSGMIATYAALVSAINTAGGDAVVVSRYTNKAPRTAGIGTPITSVNVDINLDSQRRRLAGRGQ